MSADPWSSRVLGFVDEHAEEIVADLAGLVRVPSVSGTDEENALQHVLLDRMRGLGLETDGWQVPLAETMASPRFPGAEVDRREAWGTAGRLAGRGDGPSLMLNAHVDVVPPGDPAAWAGVAPFAGTIDGRTLYGRGACDMKGGLIAAYWAVRACAELRVPLRGDLLFATVIGEEDGGLGTFALLDRGWTADACVIPEPTSLDIAPGSAGALTFRLTVRGLATHASRRSSGVSAIELFLPVFAALRRLEARRNEVRHPLAQRWDLPIPIEIGTVAAGEWASTVPELLTAEGRLGVAVGEDTGAARLALEEAVAEVCAGHPWLRQHPVEVQWWGGQFEPGLTDPDAAIVGTVRSAHARVSPRPVDMWLTPYGSDLRLMRNVGGVPTVHYGPGDAGLAHAPQESVDLDEVLTATRALALVALDHCGVA
ncbi:ArgE/DapE family deacylase [Actinoplanes sp. DH11]|uniref:ArgE/DapE family deacylase n=1 Tax=Actinoplanes sp. DH11 TaxID=2857011 RepID=UPI001E62B908|nr:ArgE/DapE family deacylase [Actinoplanes sp. DH11]